MNRTKLTAPETRVVQALRGSGRVRGFHALASRITDRPVVDAGTLRECLAAVQSLQASGQVRMTKAHGTVEIELNTFQWPVRRFAATATCAAFVLAGCANLRSDLPQYGPQPLPTYHPAQYHKTKQEGTYWSYCEDGKCPDPTPKSYKVEAPAPQPRKKETLSLSADVLFDFDSASLKPKGREVLDKLASQLKNRGSIEVQILGYTDRLGSDAYNMKLSQRRAEVVRVFMSTYISGSKIEAFGRGKANPVTDGACSKSMPIAKLRQCLQPDRRVEINVTQAD